MTSSDEQFGQLGLIANTQTSVYPLNPHMENERREQERDRETQKESNGERRREKERLVLGDEGEGEQGGKGRFAVRVEPGPIVPQGGTEPLCGYKIPHSACPECR